MRPLLLLLFLPALGGCQGTLPGAETSALRPGLGERHGVLLWVPEAGRPDWSSLERMLRKHDRLRLTVAAAAEGLSPEERQRLAPFVAEGRLEFAARIPGDPPLPLIFDIRAAALRYEGQPPATDLARPQDLADRLALEREAFRSAWGVVPAGLVPAGGALSMDMLPLVRNLGFQWVAVGDYRSPESSQGWINAEGLWVVPFKDIISSAPAPGIFQPGVMTAAVLDPSFAAAPPGSLEEVLEGGLVESAERWWTVSQASRAVSPDAPAASTELPSWKGSLSPWIGGPAQSTAWELLGKAARALDRYQNSGRASLKILEEASHALYSAQSGRAFLEWGRAVPGPELGRLDQEFRAALLRVFKLAGESAPRELLRPLASAELSVVSSTEAETSPVRSGPNWVTFLDPEQDAVPLPEVPQVPAPWELKGFKVEWDEQSMLLSLYAAGLKRPAQPGPLLEGLLIDVYIDQNHLLGSGSRAMLPGRGGSLDPRDAWEYALTVSGEGAQLYKARRQGSPARGAGLQPIIDFSTGEITLRLDRATLRGNPRFWGYLVVSMAAEPGSPSTPRAGDPVLLDVVSPEEGTGPLQALRAPPGGEP